MHKKTFLTPLFFALILGVSSASVSASDAQGKKNSHWSYAGEDGPNAWGQLNQEYITCQTGKRQSPINLDASRDRRGRKGGLPTLRFRYNASPLSVDNNGHTLQFNYAQGSHLEAMGKTYQLKQFHLHAPSEHSIHGRPYDMEAHFVHQDEAGNLAVVGVMFLTGPRNGLLEKLLPLAPTKVHQQTTTPVPFNGAFLLPRYHDYYHYDGSLTTPPCSEGVSWFVLKYPAYASREQIAFFKSIIQDNARPRQALNGRNISESEY